MSTHIMAAQGLFLDGLTGVGPVVHQDDRNPFLAAKRGQGRVSPQAPDIIDQAGSGGQGSFGDFSFVGVHRDRNINLAGQPFNHR